MKVSGFTFLRNGQTNDYPYVASIQSLLPLVDEMVIALGPSDDATLEVLQALANPKIRVIRTTWCDTMRDHGFLYGQQKMIAQYNCTGDWAFYLEADEVLHENQIPIIRKALQQYVDDPSVEALVLNYIHFYGSPNTYLQGHRWYPREVRVIKTSVRSICPDNLWWEVLEEDDSHRYPRAAMVEADIYHYGWLRKSLAARRMQKPSPLRKPKTSMPDDATLDPTLLHDFTGRHPGPVQSWLHGKTDRVYQINPQPPAEDRPAKLINRVQEFLHQRLTPEHFTLVK